MTGPLVTGASGQLGRALRSLLPSASFFGSSDLDITSRTALSDLDWDGVTAVINAAAWTGVDAAEDPSDMLRAWDVNATGVANLAFWADHLDVPLVHVSSDYVLGPFSFPSSPSFPLSRRGFPLSRQGFPLGRQGFPLGRQGSPLSRRGFPLSHRGSGTAEYLPRQVTALPDPAGRYAIGKAAGEFAARLAPKHYVVRTSWVFGDGPNFVRTMRRLAATRDEVTVVDDQLGRPTYAVDLANALIRLVDSGTPWGTYHATGSGDVVSWAGFAAAILEGTGCKVRPVSTAEYAAGRSMAPRPAYSALDLSSLEAIGITMRDWRDALAEYLKIEGETS